MVRQNTDLKELVMEEHSNNSAKADLETLKSELRHEQEQHRSKVGELKEEIQKLQSNDSALLDQNRSKLRVFVIY